ncbi:MAG: porin family protein [Chlorobi bacterium]|nr:porin family protein [Chlorobiota bacterium]MCI0714819.1 porin family protein [Chlorobiota bacterium]
MISLTGTELFSQPETSFTSKDTSYNFPANKKIFNMLKRGKAPMVTLQLSFAYNIGHMDLASDDNTRFRKDDFELGRNFGTRYGFGVSLLGKIRLNKEGYIRLNVGTSYNRFLSNFVISESPEGKVAYNVFSGSLGVENNFSPQKKIKPYVGLDIIANFISGKAVLATDSTDFNLRIRSSFRVGLSLNLGFEYAFNNRVGFNLGYRLTHANLIGRQNKASNSPSETYLNDDKIKSNDPNPPAYSGWKQFLYSQFYTGINYYFGMKNTR